MSIHETKFELVRFAYAKLQEWNLTQRGWVFEFCRSKKIIGLCKYNSKTICLSHHYVENGSPIKEMENTILHELAHALAGLEGDFGHGKIWKKWCVIVGCEPSRLCHSKEIKTVDTAWKGTCSKCSKVFGFHRKPKNIKYRYHDRCGPESSLKWTHFGRAVTI